MIVKIYTSPLKTKRYMVEMTDGKKIHFGLKGGNTYVDHNDKLKRDNYRARHYAQEKKFIDGLIVSPSLMSYYILWGDSTNITKNVATLNRMLKPR